MSNWNWFPSQTSPKSSGSCTNRLLSLSKGYFLRFGKQLPRQTTSSDLRKLQNVSVSAKSRFTASRRNGRSLAAWEENCYFRATGSTTLSLVDSKRICAFSLLESLHLRQVAACRMVVPANMSIEATKHANSVTGSTPPSGCRCRKASYPRQPP